jgi:plastocyanin
MRNRWIFAVLCLAPIPAVAAELSGTAQAAGKTTEYAVVWLDAAGAPPAGQARPVVLDQRNLTFEPKVMAVRVGTAVDFPNHDKVFHNVFSFRDGRKFDLGMYPAGTAKQIVFDRPGVHRIFCNIHPHMAAYIIAVETPYFAVSDERGSFVIANVPPGTYTYHAWKAGEQIATGTVAVDGSHPLAIRWP